MVAFVGKVFEHWASPSLPLLFSSMNDELIVKSSWEKNKFALDTLFCEIVIQTFLRFLDNPK